MNELQPEQKRPDLRRLPLRLKRYRGDLFERVHAPGSGLLTASAVPAIFNQSRFAGCFAQASHIKGLAPLPEVHNELAEYGGFLEPLILRAAARKRGWVAEPLRAYATCPTFSRLLASPDGLVWRPFEPTADIINWDDPGISEVKWVNSATYDAEWQDEPPVEVQLQHQSQFLCTGARWGIIPVLVTGTWRRELKIWDTEPNLEAMAMILQGAIDLFVLLDAGKLPPPDGHDASLQALYKIFPQTYEGKVASLAGEEAAGMFDQWAAATKARLDAEKVEKDAKKFFSLADPEAGVFALDGDRKVVCKTIEREGYTKTVEAGTYRRWDLVPPGGKKRKNG